jgi:hypothetical protein
LGNCPCRASRGINNSIYNDAVTHQQIDRLSEKELEA